MKPKKIKSKKQRNDKQLAHLLNKAASRDKLFYVTKDSEYADECRASSDNPEITFIDLETFESNVDAGVYKGLRADIHYDNDVIAGFKVK